ncbi:MAG: LpxD N-terminal domain-containing protein, partial [Cyanobacteria bacterium P01_H01_bin.58]
MRIQDIAHHLNARLEPGNIDLDIHGVATLDEATAQDITFLTNAKYQSKIKKSSAGAIIVSEKFVADGLTIPLVRVAYPDLAFAQAIELFHPQSRPQAAIHPTAVLGQDVKLGQNVFIGPYVVMGDRVTIGDNVVIHAHCAIYDDVAIGPDSVIHSHVALR